MSEFIDYVFQRSTSLNKIDNSLYSKYNVKNGLRNEDGTGVLVGLTKISDVVGYKKENDKKIDTEGELYYRGVKVSDFIKGHDPKNRFLFEEACFLILFAVYLLLYENKSQNEKEVINHLLYENRKQYQLKKESIDLINHKCHDLKHQIEDLKNMQTEDRNETLNKLQKEIMILIFIQIMMFLILF